MHFKFIVQIIIFYFCASYATELHNCNEAVCASLVSKCMLIKSCGCNMQINCTCCKDCYKCLQNLYTECCSCVGMCPESIGEEAKRSLKSSIEDLSDIIPGLFDVLTEEADHLNRWTVISYNRFEDLDFLTPDWEKYKNILGMDTSIDTEKSKDFFGLGDEEEEEQASTESHAPKDAPTLKKSQNCTVLYMYDCMSLHKCRMTCNSMGASKYRWFHDGCCECVGHTCLSYGKNVSRCSNCPKINSLPSDYKIPDILSDEL